MPGVYSHVVLIIECQILLPGMINFQLNMLSTYMYGATLKSVAVLGMVKE